MSNPVLVVVDVQNDFCKGGVLEYKYPAISNTHLIAEKAKETIEKGGKVIFTRDTHDDREYLNSLEGTNLPIPHCIKNTQGWEFASELKEIYDSCHTCEVRKETFGTTLVGDLIKDYQFLKKGFCNGEIQVCGYCTSFCVASICTILRAQFPNTKITLLQDLCGDINEESHRAAIKVLRNINIEIK